MVVAAQPMNLDVVIRHLTTEYQVNPMPLDVGRPRLGWQLVSSARCRAVRL
jgi:hypothetical protein